MWTLARTTANGNFIGDAAFGPSAESAIRHMTIDRHPIGSPNRLEPAGLKNALAGHVFGQISNQDMHMNGYKGSATIYLRVAIGIGFLSAVADRLGLWGPPGTPNVAWGTFQNFLNYTAKLNPWFPGAVIPAVGWIATACEFCFGVMLVVGYRTRVAAVLSGWLALAFAIGMVCGVGIHAPLNYSVFVLSAASFLLAGAANFPLSLDNWRSQP